DFGDVRRIGDRAVALLLVRFLWGHARDETAGRRGALHMRELIVKCGLDGPIEVANLGRGTLLADGVLIVNHAAVAKDPLLVEYKYLGSCRGVERPGQSLRLVLQNRERDSQFSGLLGDRLQRVLRIGVDADEPHTFFGEFLAGFLQPRRVAAGDGTAK